ncbi:MAG: phosphoribosyltransferase family protein [Candidatus Thermoplasmatota archaeon]|nr:phosphoribosyltransferase family protein [Candidatus Thermoplasmatota archaeon]
MASQEKLYVDANSLLSDSMRLARKVWDSGFRPDRIIALWRGGTPVGIAVHEFLKVKGAKMEHMAIKAQSYVKFEQTGKVDIIGIEHVVEGIKQGEKLLVVDDVFDTGLTMEAVARAIKESCKEKRPDVRTATVYYKPLNNRTSIKPDFYVKECNGWIVFPHEIEGLSDEEVKRKGMGVYDVLKGRF